MYRYEYVVLDDDGIPIRKFKDKQSAQSYTYNKPEFEIKKITYNLIDEVGECKF